MAKSSKTGKLAGMGSFTEILLFCGILASAVYAVSDLAGSLSWEGYSPLSQAFSELNAIGAPTRTLMLILLAVDNVLFFAFGLGLILAHGKKAQSIAGFFVIANALAGLSLPFFPMHVRGMTSAGGDIGHIILTVVTVIFIILIFCFGAFSRGKGFMAYTLVTLAVVVAFGVWAGQDGVSLSLGEPTPWLGLKERVNIYAYMAWNAVFALRSNTPKRGK
jgi:hypothetical protein